MIYWFSLLGFGDTLISASMLEKFENRDSVTLVGTKTAQEVCLLINSKLKLYVPVEDTPWVFNVKQRSMFDYVTDRYTIKRFIDSSTTKEDVLFFEHPSRTRTMLICGPTTRDLFNIRRGNNVYVDRASAVRPYLGEYRWPPAPILRERPKSLLINPSARFADKEIPKSAVDTMLSRASRASVETTLIDVSGKYVDLQLKTDHYLLRPNLEQSANCLMHSSFYVGPDSFFSHLAYYYGIPQLGIYKKSNLYFRPPGLLEAGGIYYLEDLANRSALNRKLDELLQH